VQHESSLSAVRKAILLIIGAVVASGFGCGPPTIWSAEARSPDKSWLVSARTLENAGFGTGAYITEVQLKRLNVSTPPQVILSFFHDPSLPSPQSGATINLTMKWATPKHLEVTYEGHANLSFQVVKCGDIDISTRDLSNKATSALK
jgi:hypothetical protein